jgi:hypothetical protein
MVICRWWTGGVDPISKVLRNGIKARRLRGILSHQSSPRFTPCTAGSLESAPRVTYDMVWLTIWFDLRYGLTYDMVWLTIWFDLRYGLPYDMVWLTIWFDLRYGLPYDMVWLTIWFDLRYDLTHDMACLTIWFDLRYGLTRTTPPSERRGLGWNHETVVRGEI